MLVPLITPFHVVIHRGPAALDVRLNPRASLCITARTGGKVVWHDIPRDWRPWRLDTTDVAHEGKEQFLVGLYMHTRHSPKRLHTLFIYGFDGEKVIPKWRGSFLGRDFTDFQVIHSKLGDRVATIDTLLNGEKTVACYEWLGFGLHKIWERGHFKWAKLLHRRDLIQVRAPDGTHKYDRDGGSPR